MLQNRIKKSLVFLFAVLTAFVGSLFTSSETVSAKELTNVISSIVVRNGNLQAFTPDDKGGYVFGTGGQVNFVVGFDLSGYDNKLQNGDTFTFKVPKGITVYNDALTLTEVETKLPIGNVKITSNGPAEGGTAVVTLSNLEEYAKKKLATQQLSKLM